MKPSEIKELEEELAELRAEVERLRAQCDGSAKHTMALEQQNIALLRWQAVASDAHVDHLCDIIRALAVADETPRVLRDLSAVGVEEEVRRAFAAERINREKSEAAAREWRKKAEDAEALHAEVERLRAEALEREERTARIMLEAERQRRISDEAVARLEKDDEEQAEASATWDQVEAILDGFDVGVPRPGAKRVADLLREVERLREDNDGYLLEMGRQHALLRDQKRGENSERAAVVAWLRRRTALRHYADCIERGEHRREGGRMMSPFDAEKVAALRERAARRVRPFPEPRYDNVFYEGVAWLDSLAEADSIERGEHREEKE